MKNKLKIAVIDFVQYNSRIGGVEKYYQVCFEKGTKKYDVTELPLYGTKKYPENLNKYHVKTSDLLKGGTPKIEMIGGGTYTRKKIKQLLNNFDVIICNTDLGPRNLGKNHKLILVQHGDSKKNFSFWKGNLLTSIGAFLSALIFNTGSIFNVYKKIKNAVFYDESTQFATNAQNIGYIPLAHKLKKEIKKKKHPSQGFVWHGRIENKQKNIDALITLANANHDLSIYGQGDYLKTLQKKLNNPAQYKKVLKQSEIDDVLQKSKCFVLTSNTEGFCFSVVESLSNGTPVIMFDTFRAAKFFAKSGAVFLIPQGDMVTFQEKMNGIKNLSAEEYANISSNAINFAQKHLSKENFGKKWDDVLQKFAPQTLDK